MYMVELERNILAEKQMNKGVNGLEAAYQQLTGNDIIGQPSQKQNNV